MTGTWQASDWREVAARAAHRLAVAISPERCRAAAAVISLALLGGIAGVAVSAPAAAAGKVVTLADNETEQLVVSKGKSATVRVETVFSDIIVGDPDIATVAPLTDRSLYVIGKAVGATSVAVFDTDRRLIGSIEIEVSSDTGRLTRQLRQAVPGAAIKVSSINGRIMLSGTAPDAPALKRAVAIANEYGEDVINSVTIGRSQQVLLEVRFLEASRNASKELGVNWNAVGNWNVVTGVAGLVSRATPFGTIVGNLLSNGVEADAIIRALEERGLARRLAEPNLVALSGDRAEFLAGGEFPFPVQGSDNRITIEFKKFGVGLAFTPTVLSDDVINLKIEPEVSQLDSTNVIRLENTEIPSLVVRRAMTTVELRDGQSFVIAGLLQATSTTAREQLPWIGDVPVLGTLFRSASYQREETDLTIIVTPRLVQPLTPGQIARSPLDNTRPANDIDFFIHGRDEVKTANAHSLRFDNRHRPGTGHIIDLPKR
jgi:pilus assembly protein CpaC